MASSAMHVAGKKRREGDVAGLHRATWTMFRSANPNLTHVKAVKSCHDSKISQECYGRVEPNRGILSSNQS